MKDLVPNNEDPQTNCKKKNAWTIVNHLQPKLKEGKNSSGDYEIHQLSGFRKGKKLQ